MIAWHILIIDQTNAMDMAKQVRYSNLVILVLIVGFLCCIASSSAAITEKSVKNLNKLENKNQSVNMLMSKSNVGLTLFDGKTIIQNKSVMTQVKQNLTVVENLHSEVAKRYDYQNWTLRQYADYVADPSHSIDYWITTTNGILTAASEGKLGYSTATDQIIGDKNNWYVWGLSDIISEETIHFLNNLNRQWRLTIDPDENHMLLQEWNRPHGTTPDNEYIVALNQRGFGHFGGTIGELDYFAIHLCPDPIP